MKQKEKMELKGTVFFDNGSSITLYGDDEGEKKDGSIDRMPEGWKNLDRITNEPTNYGSCTGWPKKDARKYLDLLKEMAEATEEMVTACKQGYARDISKMERALQRWREWK